jgi:hypothetical protein
VSNTELNSDTKFQLNENLSSTERCGPCSEFHQTTSDIELDFIIHFDCLCGLVVSVEDYKHRGPGFDSRALLRIFLRELGLERDPLSLVIG